MKIIRNAFLCNLILIALAMPLLIRLSGDAYSESSFYMMIILEYIATIIFICLFYVLFAKKCNTLALPLGFFIFPFFLFFIMTGMRSVIYILSDPEGWEILAAIAAFYHSWPLCILTGIISSKIEKDKKNHLNRQSPGTTIIE